VRLLIVTQRVDQTDPILGFFHGWLRAFGERGISVTVIGQQTGSYDLPANVRVHSLEKEKGRGRFSQILRFWRLVVLESRSYDRVFVHMTPIWVVLGCPVWILRRKPMYLWYEARGGGWALLLALRLVHKVFGATDYGLPRNSRRHVIVGHGIDTERFRPNPTTHAEGLLVTVGRVTPVKHYDVLLRMLAELPQHCRLRIAGGTFTDRDRKEEKRLQELIAELRLATRVTMGWMAPQDIVALLQSADCMVHACTGGLDKCVLEAMACGCPVISSSEAASRVLPETCVTTDEGMTERVRNILGLSSEERADLSRELRQRVVNGHSLQHLVQRLAEEMR
jgi:glycosyltransferase involved in cell wall biosynthesis